ncbi:hypothetical protein D3C75_542020 [compost metagenome]
MQEDALQLFTETSHNFARQLLFRFDIFFTGTSQEVLLQLCIHAYHLILNNIGMAQAFAVLVAWQRLRHTGFKRLDHTVEINPQLTCEFLYILLTRGLLEHFFHFIKQAESQVSRHFLNRKHSRRGTDNVVFIVSWVGLVHLRNVGADITDIVMDGEFFTRLFFFTRHKVRDVLRRYVHTVIVRILQQLTLGIRCRDQMT